jgi:hypothetical protein
VNTVNSIENDCLCAALTLLIKSEVLDESQITQVIIEGGHDKLFDLLNDKYKEIVKA